MNRIETAIAVYVRREGIAHTFYTYPNEYRNLMELLNDKFYLEDFGSCRGVGRCGTCIIHVHASQIPLTQPERNEQTTLTRCHISTTDMRLACQILVDSSINGLVLELLAGYN